MPQSSLLVILQTFLTQRALKGKLDTQKALQENFKAIAKVLLSTEALKGCLGTWKLKVLGHYDVEALRHLKSTWALYTQGTQAFGQSDTWALEQSKGT